MGHLVGLFYVASFVAAAWISLSTNYGFWAVLAFVAVVAGGKLLSRYGRLSWRLTADTRPLIFVDARMGVRPTILGNRVPDGYRFACLFFGSGLIDRTRRLDHGFRYDVLDPIPDPSGETRDIATLCDERAHQIADLARSNGCRIHLLWSGGIDSTGATVALVRALEPAGELNRLRIFYSPASRREYPAFFSRHIKGRIDRQKIQSLAPAFQGDAIVVTGEHGDQLFGSATALGLPFDLLETPWERALPELLERRLASEKRAVLMTEYLSPQIRGAPVPVKTLYDCLWWLNFSLKWQAVSLRMVAGQTVAPPLELQQRVQHFFRTDDFQRWALRNPDKRIRQSWESYKWPLRDYIFAFTGDVDYRDTKLKQPSLRGMLGRPVKRSALALTAAGMPVWQLADESLRKPLPAEKAQAADGDGPEISFEFTVGQSRSDTFEPKREEPLWDDLSEGE